MRWSPLQEGELARQANLEGCQACLLPNGEFILLKTIPTRVLQTT